MPKDIRRISHFFSCLLNEKSLAQNEWEKGTSAHQNRDGSVFARPLIARSAVVVVVIVRFVFSARSFAYLKVKWSDMWFLADA